WVPLAWEAFVDYRLEAMTLSRAEGEAVRAMLAGERPDLAALGLSKREQDELRAKLGSHGARGPGAASRRSCAVARGSSIVGATWTCRCCGRRPGARRRPMTGRFSRPWSSSRAGSTCARAAAGCAAPST